jgi:hypothetical protein
MTTYGPTFGEEVIAAGLGGAPFSWNEDEIFGRDDLTDEQNQTLDEVIASHDPSAQLPIPPDTKTVAQDHEARIQALEIQTGLREGA